MCSDVPFVVYQVRELDRLAVGLKKLAKNESKRVNRHTAKYFYFNCYFDLGNSNSDPNSN